MRPDLSKIEGCEWNPEKDGPAIEGDAHNATVPATVSVGAGRNNWHLCEACAVSPMFKGKRRRVPIGQMTNPTDR